MSRRRYTLALLNISPLPVRLIGMVQLDPHYCHRCKVSHPFGKHRGIPSPSLPPHLAQTPAGASLHSYPNGQRAPVSAPLSAIHKNPLPEPKYKPIKPRDRSKPFDKGNYQARYMADRRKADRTGFKHLSVAEYRAMMDSQEGG